MRQDVDELVETMDKRTIVADWFASAANGFGWKYRVPFYEGRGAVNTKGIESMIEYIGNQCRYP